MYVCRSSSLFIAPTPPVLDRAVALNELGRMFLHFGDAPTACKFFRRSADLKLAPHREDEGPRLFTPSRPLVGLPELCTCCGVSNNGTVSTPNYGQSQIENKHSVVYFDYITVFEALYLFHHIFQSCHCYNRCTSELPLRPGLVYAV